MSAKAETDEQFDLRMARGLSMTMAEYDMLKEYEAANGPFDLPRESAAVAVSQPALRGLASGAKVTTYRRNEPVAAAPQSAQSVRRVAGKGVKVTSYTTGVEVVSPTATVTEKRTATGLIRRSYV